MRFKTIENSDNHLNWSLMRGEVTRGGRSLWVLLLMIWLGNFKYSEKVVSNERWSQREVRLYLFAYFFICFILQHYVYTTCVSHQGLCETDGLLPKCIINADQLCFGICFNKHTVLPSFYDCWGLSLTITLRIKRRTERGGGGGTVVGKWEWAIVQRLNALGTFYYAALTDNHW